MERSQLAAIHIAKKEAGLSEKNYRQLLDEVAGVPSAKYLSDDGYQAVMRELKGIQYDNQSKAKARPKSPAERKIWALWYDLRNYLPIQERTAAYLCGFARRASGCDELPSLGDLSAQQAYRVIEALKARLAQEVATCNVNNQEAPF